MPKLDFLGRDPMTGYAALALTAAALVVAAPFALLALALAAIFWLLILLGVGLAALWRSRRALYWRVAGAAAPMLGLAALMAIGLLSFPAPAFAAAASTTVDLSPLINALAGLAGAVILAMIPLIVARLKAAGAIKDTAMANALQNAATMAAQYGINTVQSQLAGKTVTLDLKNAVVASAAQYVAQHVPAAIAHFGKSNEDIAQMILARLDLTGGTVSLSGQPTPTPAAQ